MTTHKLAQLNGENLGRLFARSHGLEVFNARIGWLVPELDPRDSKWVRTEAEREYMRAMYLGHDDCDEIFHRAISVPGEGLLSEARRGARRGGQGAEESGARRGGLPKGDGGGGSRSGDGDGRGVQALGGDGGFSGTFYAVSGNGRRVFQLGCVERLLGYRPRQDAEHIFGEGGGQPHV